MHINALNQTHAVSSQCNAEWEPNVAAAENGRQRFNHESRSTAPKIKRSRCVIHTYAHWAFQPATKVIGSFTSDDFHRWHFRGPLRRAVYVLHNDRREVRGCSLSRLAVDAGRPALHDFAGHAVPLLRCVAIVTVLLRMWR